MKIVKLGDVCEFRRGLTYKKNDEVAIAKNVVLRANNIDPIKYKLNLTDLKYLSESLEIPESKYIKKNTILICTASGSKSHLGKVALIEEDYRYAFGGFMGLIVPDYQQIDTKYLYRVLTSSLFRDLIDGLTDGTNINNLKFSLIENFKFELPSLEEQQRVVERLDAAFEKIDRAIELTEKNIENVHDLRLVATKGLLERVDGQEKTVGDVIKLEYGKPLDRGDRKLDGKFAAYGANGIKDMTDRYYSDTPSIIVGRKGSAGELTRVDQPFWPLDVTYYVTHNAVETDIDYVYYILSSLDLPSLARGVKPGINRNDIYSLPFILPDIKDQKVIAERIDELHERSYKLIEKYKDKIAMLNNLKQTLLTQVFSRSEVE